MKIILLMIIGIISLGMIFPSDSFAQSSDSDQCPKGSKVVIKGMDITCVSINDVVKKCPVGTYQGKDNQGNFACRDINSNNLVDPKTGLVYDSQTGKLIQKENPPVTSNPSRNPPSTQMPNWLILPLIGVVIILAIIVKIKQGPYVGGSWNNPPSMKQLAVLRDYEYDGPMPLSSREAWERIADLKRGGYGRTREELEYDD
jgi:hypothetical protein